MPSQLILPAISEFKKSYERRKRNHDYRKPFKYHIILKKASGFKDFGRVVGDANIPPGKDGCAEISRSRMGSIIHQTIFNFSFHFPAIKVLQFVVMPDHVHILLQVIEELPQHLGHYIGDFKILIAQTYSKRYHKEVLPHDIFKANYTDRIVWSFIKLETIYTYIQENPHRLAMRIQYPQFFTRKRNLVIAGVSCEGYGNFFLLKNPDKMSLIIHINYTPEERKRVAEECINNCFEGGIIVSGKKAANEKSIWRLCEEAGGKFILINHEEFGERYKPSAHDFNLCCQGRLLILSLKFPKKTPLSRVLCQTMNNLAQEICKL